jgi:hypothetical protein
MRLLWESLTGRRETLPLEISMAASSQLNDRL